MMSPCHLPLKTTRFEIQAVIRDKMSFDIHPICPVLLNSIFTIFLHWYMIETTLHFPNWGEVNAFE